MSTFEKGFDAARTRDRLLQRLLSHNRGLEVTGQTPRQPRPQEVGRTVLSARDLRPEIEHGARASVVVQANIADLS